MPLPLSWIDELFGRLSLTYGAAFLRQYADLEIAAVKADWAKRLDGVSGETIAYALDNLPPSPPVTALQFRAICKGRPDYHLKALPPPKPTVDPEGMARVKAKLAAVRARLAGAA